MCWHAWFYLNYSLSLCLCFCFSGDAPFCTPEQHKECAEPALGQYWGRGRIPSRCLRCGDPLPGGEKRDRGPTAWTGEEDEEEGEKDGEGDSANGWQLDRGSGREVAITKEGFQEE